MSDAPRTNPNESSFLPTLVIVLILAAGGIGFAIWMLLETPPLTPVPPDRSGGSGESAPDLLSSLPGEDVEPIELVRFAARLTDPLGKAVAGARITFDLPPPDAPIEAITDGRGAFSIELPATRRPVVRVEASGFYPQLLELERNTEFPILLFRGGIVRGVVRGPMVDENGSVEVVPLGEVLIELAGADGWFHTVTSDSGGRYEFTAPTGSIVLTVHAADHADTRILDVDVSREEPVVRDIELTSGVAVEVVLFGEGTMVAGARVRAITELGEETEAITDGLGKVTLRGLTPGPGMLVITSPGSVAQLHKIVLAADRPLTRRPITLTASVPWELEVVDGEGNPRADAEVRIRLDRIDLVTTTAGDREALQILGPDREYWISVDAPDAPRVQVPFRLPADASPLLRVELTAGGRFTGTVHDRRGQPVAGAGILVVPTGPSARSLGPPRVGRTGLDGTFRTERWGPGSYRVQAHHPELGRAAVDTKITDGEDIDLGTLELED